MSTELAIELAIGSPDARTPDWTVIPTGRHRSGFPERDTGFEPATLSLGNSKRGLESLVI
jgi:hypothetical protein